MLTGLHGVHVIIGTLFLIVGLYRAVYSHYTANTHVGYEAAASSISLGPACKSTTAYSSTWLVIRAFFCLRPA